MTQTEQRAASVELEWWWNGRAAADQTVRSKQKTAIFLEIERMIILDKATLEPSLPQVCGMRAT